ncbi:MAG TPA: hypothetical protein VGR48_08460 [Terriglobales bacterium]|nr:hypothetical protein [Terriglobales bacterium]
MEKGTRMKMRRAALPHDDRGTGSAQLSFRTVGGRDGRRVLFGERWIFLGRYPGGGNIVLF